MNLRLLATFLTLGSLATGCVVVDHDACDTCGHNPSGRRGDIQLTWTFAGMNCRQAPEVAHVRVTVDGERLENDGLYGCSNAGTMGIILHDFRAGTYRYRVEALDGDHEPVYETSGRVTVDGTVQLDVDLAPLRTFADFSWNFPANADASRPDCALAGTPYVAMHIGGQDGWWQQALDANGRPIRIEVNGEFGPELRDVIPCEWGQSAEGFRVELPGPGTYAVELYAVDDKGFRYYVYGGTVTGYAGRAVAAEYDLLWDVGGLAIQWQLFKNAPDGKRAVTCSEAGVGKVTVRFEDAVTHQFIYEPNYMRQWDCTAQDAYFFLPPGDYYVYVDDVASPPRYYNVEPALIHVEAGVFAGHPLWVPLDQRT